MANIHVPKDTLKGKVAIIGVGESPVGKVPGKSSLWLAANASIKAMKDAGIDKSEIDGVLTGHSFVSPFHRFSVALSEYMGIQPTFSNSLQVSGATAAASINVAAAAINSGLAEAVLVTMGDNMLSGLTPDLAIKSMTESRDQQYETPFGVPVANTFAMTALRHMHQYGTTSEQFAQVAVTFREHAQLKPGAQKQDPITIGDVLESSMNTTPYHKLDCALISDGGAALILTSAERAREIRKDPIYILGGGEAYTHEHIFMKEDITSTGAVISSKKSYEMAGVTPKDIDVAGIYDCFTGTVVMMIEDLGFCPKGEGGPFVADGNLSLKGGIIPTNTHGGMLSYAHPGIPASYFHFVEVVHQLRGECGERQVRDAHLGLVHSLGAGFATQATTILGKEMN